MPSTEVTGDPGRPDSDSAGQFVDLIGLEFDEVGPERVVGSVDVGPQHRQPMGLVHGGLYCSMVETLASVGAYRNVHDRGLLVVGVANTTDFIRPHRHGRLVAVAEPLHVGRTQQLWQTHVSPASTSATKVSVGGTDDHDRSGRSAGPERSVGSVR